MMNFDVFDGLAMASGGVCLFMSWAYLQASRRSDQPGTGLLSVSMLFAAITWLASATVGTFQYKGNLPSTLIVLVPAFGAVSTVTFGFLQYVTTGPSKWQKWVVPFFGLLALGQFMRGSLGTPEWTVDALISGVLCAMAIYCLFRHVKEPNAGYLLIGAAFFVQPITFLVALNTGIELDHMRQLLGIPFALIGVMVFLIGFFRTHDLLALQLDEISNNRKRLHRMVYVDEVTQLRSQQAQRERLDELIFSGAAFSLMLINLDDFRITSNNFGLNGSNAIIAQVARILEIVASGKAEIARSAGAEFTLLLPNTIKVEELEQIASQLATAMETPLSFDGTIAYVSLSIGIARFPTDAINVDGLLRAVNVALLQVKSQGGNAFSCYARSMDDGMQEQIWLDQNLRDAIFLGQLELHYQPKLLLKDGYSNSVEALLRWRHPERGNIRPDVFIPRAEATGQIIPIGRWVIHTAAAQAKIWVEAGLPTRVAINVSASQLSDPELMNHLRIAQSEAMGHLDLELTESSLVASERDALRFIVQCRELGFGVHLDDFGTGYSSLSRLGNLPLTMIKLDRSFIAPIGQSSKANALLKAMLSIGTELRLQVVAEGVETEKQAEFLRDLGVRYAQGWLYGRAMPAHECWAWLIANRSSNVGSFATTSIFSGLN